MIKLEQINYTSKIEHNCINASLLLKTIPINIDRVVYRSMNEDGEYYTKPEVDNLLTNKVNRPTQAEWDNFELTLQGI